MRRLYSQKLLGSVCIQKTLRRHFCQQRFLLQKRGFVALQVKAKQTFKVRCAMSTLLQRHWRMVSARKEYKNDRAASILIQKQVRKAIGQHSFRRMQRGFSTLQGLAKLWFRIKSTCAVTIQTVVRQNTCRKRFLEHLQATVRVQCAFRGFLQRRNYQVLRWLRSIASTMISGWWRRVSFDSGSVH